MLLIQDQTIKLGGIVLSGQVKSIDIAETATIEDIKDDKGATKANQPTGYEAAKVSIDFILESSPGYDIMNQMIDMQRLFKEYGQTEAKLLEVVNEDCIARGITQVFFQKLTTKNVISESKRTATLELLAPTIAGIKLVEIPINLLGMVAAAAAMLTGVSPDSIKTGMNSPVNLSISADGAVVAARALM